MLSKKTKSFADTSMIIREPETTRLGRDTDKLVESMEHEKRESVYLDQQIMQLQEELNQIKSTRKNIFPSAYSESHQKNKCLVLEKKIELEVINLNQTKCKCEALRSQINNYRKDKSHYKRTLQNINDDINNFSKAAENEEQEYLHGIQVVDKYKKKLQTLRSTSMMEKSLYSEKISEYSTFIREKVEIRKQIHKQIEQGIIGHIKKQTDSIDFGKIQNTLLAKWQDKLREKKKELDKYLKYLGVLQDTFEQIKIATGIHSVNEIVTAVIKSEEQNYEVYSYVNSLNSEIDQLKETYTKTLSDIEDIESQPKAIYNQKADLLNKILEKKEKKKLSYEKSFNQIQNFFPHIKKLLKFCIDSSIPITKPDINLDIETIEYEQIFEFLGYVEDYIGYAIAFTKTLEGTQEDKKREKTPINIKDLEIKESEGDFEDSRVPLSVQEFQQRTIALLKENK